MALSAKDLRIGNKLFNNLSQVHTVCQIQFEHNNVVDEECWIVGDNNHEISLLDLHPIPLSPDILERCLGVQAHFGKLLRVYSFDISNGSGYKTISLTVEEGNQYIYLRQGDLKSERHNDAVITIYNADVRGPIMLHYFQNLFIDLTGEELTITL